ncbi:MAG TPA: DUF6644 family protein [Bryobacteraceae bacterium]|nr:DUF6644 family protein [Bryobacteraceae bacterium]
MNHLLPSWFFQWCVNTPLARLISQSMWGFAVLETFHIAGLVMVLGSILVVDLTVLGFGMRQPAERLARQVAPWGLAGLVVMIASGVPMFLSAAVTYSGSTPFAIKMTLLACGMGLQLGMHARSGMYAGSGAGKIAACLSLICWFGVAYAGRGIAFEVLFGTGG